MLDPGTGDGAPPGRRSRPGTRAWPVAVVVFGLVAAVRLAAPVGWSPMPNGGAAATVWGLVAALPIGLLLGAGLIGGGSRASLGKLAGYTIALLAFGFVVGRLLGRPIDVGPAIFTLAGCFAVGRLGRFEVAPADSADTADPASDEERDAGAETADVVLTLDENGCVERLSHAAMELFGRSESETVGRHIGEIVGLDSDRLPELTALIARGVGVGELTLGRRDGSGFPAQVGVSQVARADRRGAVVWVRDLSEQRDRQLILEHQATHDALTDLPNRYLLRERLPGALADAEGSGAGVAVLLLDLDRFKEINDTLGHHTGDRLLRRIARRLPAALRPGDTVARLGGDEFAVVLPAAGIAEARRIAERLRAAVERPFRVDGLTLHVETAVGIALFPEHGLEAGALLQRADVAMYLAKRAGTGVAVYEPSRDMPNVRQLSLSNELRGAIEDGQLVLHYQPKIEVTSDRIVAVEALVRWIHPQHGCIPPDEFIGLAEQTGLIHQLTDWVLRSALEQCAAWTRNGLHLGVSVNVSARNVLDDELPQRVRRLLADTRVPPNLLTLEITESAIMENPQQALEVVVALSDLGLSISIDDFGTGYSSLGYLKNLPANEIKIDKSFVMDMDHNEEDATIVRSTIDLAHNLGLRVVAEGVETEPVWRALKRLGCDLGQGYLFSRPLAPDGFLEWLQASAGTIRTPVDSPLVEGPIRP